MTIGYNWQTTGGRPWKQLSPRLPSKTFSISIARAYAPLAPEPVDGIRSLTFALGLLDVWTFSGWGSRLSMLQMATRSALLIPSLTSLPCWRIFAHLFDLGETASFVRGTSLLVKTAGHPVDPMISRKLEVASWSLLLLQQGEGAGLCPTQWFFHLTSPAPLPHKLPSFPTCQGRSEVTL